MTRRVPSARALGRAELADFSWHTDKRGRDGSAKANIRRAPGERVWGVVYELARAEWDALDACEDGYERRVVQVELAAARGPLVVHTYVSIDLTPDPVPFAWYKQLMLDGARHHGLPEDWIARLEALRARG